MTFYQVKDGKIIRDELPADRMALEATDEGVRYVYYETTEQHETTDEQLRPARRGNPCDDAVCGANAIRMLLEDIIAGKTTLVAASSPPARIAGDGGPDTDVWRCSCGLTRPVTGSYGCADCGDGRPDSWEFVMADG